MNENKKMSSIARKINFSFWSARFWTYLGMDLLLVFGILAGYGAFCYDKLASDHINIKSAYVCGSGVNEIVMRFVDSTGQMHDFEMNTLIKYTAPILIVIGVCELIGLFFALFNTRKIRRKLKPLNDLAVKAESFSKIDFDEINRSGSDAFAATKISDLERAISHVSPEKGEASIHTGDKDLQSIEIALNNLFARMQETMKQQARFVSDASHELRTPISVIQGYVNMLDRWGKEDEEVLDESIQALKNESEHMKELIDQLLFLARGDSGRNTLKKEDFNLADVLYEVWEESVMIDEKHKYEFDAPEGETFMVHGDVAMIKQSMRIFVQNASKYTADYDTIKLRVKEVDGRPAYIIQDEGIGMKSGEVSHIFERFYRSDEARNENTGGSGLGLSIAKWIVDAHDGKIDVLTREDFGTRFTVVL